MATSPVFRADYAALDHAVDQVDLTVANHDDRAVVSARLSVRQLAQKTHRSSSRAGQMRLDAISVDGDVLNPDDFDTSAGEIAAP